MEEFPISEEDLAAISDNIQRERTAGLTAPAAPLFFFHAAQPGSGKTELNNLIQAQLDFNLLECNADTLRNNHPSVEQILQERELDYPTLTWPAANRWNNDLIDTGAMRRYNLLIETTLRNAEHALATLERMKASGYTTHLHVLAVPYRWSWLGIHIRFESEKARKKFARVVSEADHDDRFKRLAENLPLVLGSPNLDKAVLYQRQLSPVPPAPATVELVTEVKEKLVQAFFDIRNKSLDVEERRLFERDCARVVEYMQDREASPAAIATFQEKARSLAR